MRCKHCGYEKKLFGWHLCSVPATPQQSRENYNLIVSVAREKNARPKTEKQVHYSTVYCDACGYFHDGPACSMPAC